MSKKSMLVGLIPGGHGTGCTLDMGPGDMGKGLGVTVFAPARDTPPQSTEINIENPSVAATDTNVTRDRVTLYPR